MSQPSANFGFLEQHDATLARLAGFAELYCSSDPNTALVKLRQLVERLAQLAASRFGVEAGLDPYWNRGRRFARVLRTGSCHG